MKCVIYDPQDAEFFGGFDIGWTKQERLAHEYAKPEAAAKVLREWKNNPVAHRFWIVTLPSARVN